MRRPPRSASRSALVARATCGAAAVLLAACAGNDAVVRVADGHVLQGRFIQPEAYGVFLLGALADEQGDMRTALGQYEKAASLDPDDAELWTRIGRTRCRIDPDDGESEAALAEALRLDPAYEPASAARAYCATLKREGRAAADEMARAQELDPQESTTREAPSGGTPHPPADVERRRLEALTLLHGDRAAAWDALAAWGLAHGDTALAVRGLVGAVRRSTARRMAVGRAAIAFAGAGHAVAARELSAALLDTDLDPDSAGSARDVASMPLVVRLALDDAVRARDTARVHARSVRAHLGLEIAAGRAWTAGNVGLAHELVRSTVKADPGNLPSRLVHEGTAGRARAGLLPRAGARPGEVVAVAPLDPEVAIPFARDVLLTEGVQAARRVVGYGGGVRLSAGDALMTPVAVELAVAGVMTEDSLPPDARIELAARRGASPDERDVLDAALDARHRLLGLALLHPTDPAARDDADRLAGAAAEDPLIAAAIAKIALARGEQVSQEARTRLETSASTDPIAAATLVDIDHGGPSAALDRARARLAALARTPAEVARAAE
jgi:hypothetical protein